MSDEIARVNRALEGRYVVDRELGRGGMAVVYLARDIRHDRSVALKLLDREIMSEVVTARFLREIGIAARLHHPNILALFDSGEADGRPFFVMPFIEGATLRARLEQESRLPVVDALRLAKEIADALAYAHDQGVVHRDIKPENILLARYTPGAGTASRSHSLVADFGVAKALGGIADPRLTGTGYAVGTMAYMSPEQLLGGPDVDGRTDQYSLGCMLFEMITGQSPFASERGPSAVASRMVDVPPSVRLLHPEVSLGVEQLIQRLLAADPANRFVSAHRLSDALRGLYSESGSHDAIAVAGSVARTRRNSSRIAIALGALAVAVAAGYFTFVRPPIDGAGAAAMSRVTAGNRAIAVLPFVSHDSGSSGDYLADGMTEELISALGKVPALRVTSLMAAMTMKDRRMLPGQVGKDLGVELILEGGVRVAQSEMQVNVRLVETASGYTLWSETYKRPGRDALAVQQQIAKAVVNALRVKLSAEMRGRLAKGPTESPEAYEKYLQGRFFWNKRSTKDLLKALTYFSEAIVLDSAFALAYSGLADTYSVMAQGEVSPRESLRKARDAATASLRFDSTRAEGHTSDGVTRAFLNPRDTSGVNASYRRAIALDSMYPTAHQWYAISLVIAGQTEKAVSEAREAMRLSPRGVSINQGYGLVLYLAGRFEEAEAQYRATMANNPTSNGARNRLAQTLAERGQFVEAIKLARETNARTPVSVQSRGTLGYVLARGGNLSEARRIARELEHQDEFPEKSDLYPAMMYAALGNSEKSLEFLELGYERGATWLSHISTDPAFRSLRKDPRFLRLVEQVTFPPPIGAR